MDVMSDLVLPLLTLALVVTAIVCFTKLGYGAAEERKARHGRGGN